MEFVKKGRDFRLGRGRTDKSLIKKDSFFVAR